MGNTPLRQPLPNRINRARDRQLVKAIAFFAVLAGVCLLVIWLLK